VNDLPTIKPEWRTDTVVQLCQSMREQQDFSALPILADALQDAGCPEGEDVLAELRRGASFLGGQRLVAVVYSDATADAVRRVEGFAAGLGPDGYDGEGARPDYEFVMEAADQWVKCGDYTTQHGGEDWRDTGVPDEFWDDYRLILGKEPEWGEERWSKGEKVRPASFFSCSC
jgi:hypothetical protein